MIGVEKKDEIPSSNPGSSSMTVIPADDAITVGAAETAMSNVVNFIAESGVEGVMEAAEILWDLFAA